MSILNKNTLSAISSAALKLTAVASIFAYGQDVGRDELRKEIIGDIRNLTPKALSALPQSGSKFHSFDLLPGAAYWELKVLKTAGTNNPYCIEVGLANFELRGEGMKLHQVRITKPVFIIEMRGDYIVGVRTDGDRFTPVEPLEDLPLKVLKDLKRSMISLIDGRVKLAHGHPLAEIK